MKRPARVFAAVIVLLAAGFVTHGQVREFTPITDAMLLDPDPGDWPNWRRTLNGWGYSPLEQINTQNVDQLQLAWSWGLKPGLSQPNPLVAHGRMYIPTVGRGCHRPPWACIPTADRRSRRRVPVRRRRDLARARVM